MDNAASTKGIYLIYSLLSIMKISIILKSGKNTRSWKVCCRKNEVIDKVRRQSNSQKKILWSAISCSVRNNNSRRRNNNTKNKFQHQATISLVECTLYGQLLSEVQWFHNFIGLFTDSGSVEFQQDNLN